MKPISALLQIAQRFLYSMEYTGGEMYICYAIGEARLQGYMTEQEDSAACSFVMRGVHDIHPGVASLLQALKATGVLGPEARTNHADYVEYRDSFLEGLIEQARSELEVT